MSPTWFILAFSTTILSALVNVLDSHFMSRRMPGTRAYMLICGVFLLPVSIIILTLFPLPAGIGLAPIWAIVVSATITSFASLLIVNAMKSQDVASVAPVVSTAPVFVAVLATIFLGESLVFHQWLGILAVISGAVIISFRWDAKGTSHFHSRPFLILLGVAVIAAAGSVFNKYALDYMSFWTCSGIDFLVASLVILALCLRRDVVDSLKAIENSNQAITLTLVNQAIATAATMMAFWTVQLGPVALASTVFNSKPLLVFAGSAVIGRCAPWFMICEKLSPKGWVIKGAGTLAVVAGLAVVFI